MTVFSLHTQLAHVRTTDRQWACESSNICDSPAVGSPWRANKWSPPIRVLADTSTKLCRHSKTTQFSVLLTIASFSWDAIVSTTWDAQRQVFFADIQDTSRVSLCLSRALSAFGAIQREYKSVRTSGTSTKLSRCSTHRHCRARVRLGCAHNPIRPLNRVVSCEEVSDSYDNVDSQQQFCIASEKTARLAKCVPALSDIAKRSHLSTTATHRSNRSETFRRFPTHATRRQPRGTAPSASDRSVYSADIRWASPCVCGDAHWCAIRVRSACTSTKLSSTMKDRSLPELRCEVDANACSELGGILQTNSRSTIGTPPGHKNFLRAIQTKGM